MDYKYASNLMDAGCCLWVGAGLTVQLAGGPKKAPQWDALTRELEERAGLGPAHPDWDYPKRLEACSQKLSPKVFQSVLRKKYYTDFSLNLLQTAKQFLDKGDFIPLFVRQVASLGQVANPIVNFNIEPLSSLLIARPAGAMRLLSYTEPHKTTVTHDEAAACFRRLVYHPHGLATGSTVMTQSQYSNQANTLAFALAAHAAFGCDLAIVGMSLEDEYLRKQITSFRGDIRAIYWFNSEFKEAPAEWARNNRVEMLAVNWPEFWNWWFEDRAWEVNEEGLCAAWYRALLEAWAEVNGGAATSLARLFADMGRDSRLPEIASELGETGEPVAEDLAALSEVVHEVGRRINKKGFGLPAPSTQIG